MAVLLIVQGPEAGQKYPLTNSATILGRQADAAVCLAAKAVSRQHAQITQREGAFFLEDLESSNGTFLNGKRLPARQPVAVTERDRVQIGPYTLSLCPEPTLSPSEGTLVIRDKISLSGLNESVYGHAPAQKLQVVLEISQHLSRTLDLDTLINKLLDHLMRLLPQADRSMVLLLEDGNLVVRGQRSRYSEDPSTYPYSRTVVQRALDEGMGILSEDAKDDRRFDSSATITHLNLHSLICVPLIGHDNRRLGVIQVDRFRQGNPFRSEDLQLLTTIGMQAATVLDNVALHAELLREERFRQELALAREIQQGFLPTEFDEFRAQGFELFACVHPAREVSGDLYDFRKLPDGRLAFFMGDVSGKGMPAALFMMAVRTLGRHMAATSDSPAKMLMALNETLAQDNPAAMFVTLVHGIYTPTTGEVVLASGGHPMPLLRHANWTVEELHHRPGRPLGYSGIDLRLKDFRFTLVPGDTLVFFTDGVIEAREPVKKDMFGPDRLRDLVKQFDITQSLPAIADLARNAIYQFTRARELQDDLTLLLLRRSAEAKT
jgi:serine phosphatase RsbU (regulator of sigma subunit)